MNDDKPDQVFRIVQRMAAAPTLTERRRLLSEARAIIASASDTCRARDLTSLTAARDLGAACLSSPSNDQRR